MDNSTSAPAAATRIRRFLPYWAVLRADLRQTLRSWVYLVWVFVSVLGAAGYLLFRVGVQHEAGMIQPASRLVSDLLRWCVLGGVTLIIALAGGSISAERGTLADSVLSRGISRYQYFFAKWHARLAAVLGTFLVMGLIALAGGYIFLQADLSLRGSLVALTTIIAILAVVTTCSVAVSAIVNSTMLGVTVLWILLYGVGFALILLPTRYPAPDRLLKCLPLTLQGQFDFQMLLRLISCSAIGSAVAALFGVAYFARRDI